MDQQAGELLRAARRTAGLTQAALAERAATSQAAVSAYESGRRSPSVRTLARLLDSAGASLRIDVLPSPDAGRVRDRGSGATLRRLRRLRTPLLEIAKRYGVSNIRVFGSVARGQERPDSDIDLLVDLAAGRSLLDLSGFAVAVEELLGRGIDVGTEVSIKPELRAPILAEVVGL